MRLPALCLFTAIAAGAGCSLRTYAINTVGDAIASGNSVYETDDDIELVGSALPFGLKLTESLLAQSPDHPGLLLTACRGFTMYSYAFVAYEAELLNETGSRSRARDASACPEALPPRRAYGFHALELNYPGLERALMDDPYGRRRADWPEAAVARCSTAVLDRRGARPGHLRLDRRCGSAGAIAGGRGAARSRIALDETWDGGALHEFKVTLAASQTATREIVRPSTRTTRAPSSCSKGASAGLFVAYAEAVALPAQNKAEFRAMLERALAVDPDRQPQRSARHARRRSGGPAGSSAASTI